MSKVALVCSARKRAPTQNNHSKGHQWWVRDVHHASLDRLTTLCGRDCGEYLMIEKDLSPQDAIARDPHNLCTRCNKKLEEMPE